MTNAEAVRVLREWLSDLKERGDDTMFPDELKESIVALTRAIEWGEREGDGAVTVWACHDWMDEVRQFDLFHISRDKEEDSDVRLTIRPAHGEGE